MRVCVRVCACDYDYVSVSPGGGERGRVSEYRSTAESVPRCVPPKLASVYAREQASKRGAGPHTRQQHGPVQREEKWRPGGGEGEGGGGCVCVGGGGGAVYTEGQSGGGGRRRWAVTLSISFGTWPCNLVKNCTPGCIPITLLPR